jgi:hypothetical protein
MCVCVRVWEGGTRMCYYNAEIAVIVRELAKVTYTVASITTNQTN